MKKLARCVLFLFIFCIGYTNNYKLVFAEDIQSNESYNITMKRDILCLMMAYPEYITGVESSEGKVYIVMKSGRKILYDDKKEKSFSAKLQNPDLQDALEEIYPMGDIKELMAENCDPGRARVYPILKEVYGGSKAQVQSNLKGIRIGNQHFQFNKNNKAAESLQKTMNELTALAKSNSKIWAVAFPANGTFNYRVIAGTNQLSPHSFGTAIDLKSDKRDYWKWASRKDGQVRMLSYPKEIVETFEKNNFIWGGKWGHFDILHFEYRPEIIMKGKYFSNKPLDKKNWYNGVPDQDENVKNYIKLIDEKVK